eukprot:SAG22_NODE_4325_length_1303_cov_1.249169_2_plen_78_part_01
MGWADIFTDIYMYKSLQIYAFRTTKFSTSISNTQAFKRLSLATKSGAARSRSRAPLNPRPETLRAGQTTPGVVPGGDA